MTKSEYRDGLKPDDGPQISLAAELPQVEKPSWVQPEPAAPEASAAPKGSLTGLESEVKFMAKAVASSREVVTGEISDHEQARIDTLEQQQGGSRAAKKSVLGTRLPKTAEEIEREEVAAILRQNELARLQKGSKPRGPRGKRSNKETGPSAKMAKSAFPPQQ